MALREYEEVRKFQRVVNGFVVATTAPLDPYSGVRLSIAQIEVDGKWGGRETQPAAQRLADFLVRASVCSGTSATEVRRNGPSAMRHCLTNLTGVNLFTVAEVRVLQQAWAEYKAASRAPGDRRPPVVPPGATQAEIARIAASVRKPPDMLAILSAVTFGGGAAAGAIKWK